MIKYYTSSVCFLLLALVLVACSNEPIIIKPPEEKVDVEDRIHDRLTGGTKFFGDQGILTLGNTGRNNMDNNQGSGVGVNTFLWRASLEAINFMPIMQVDPFGGVIITDWHSVTETPNERYKLTILILGKTLQANALKVSMFKQKRENNNWVNSEVNPSIIRDIENNILSRARKFRIASNAQQ